jgi:molybdate transport system permease protein
MKELITSQPFLLTLEVSVISLILQFIIGVPLGIYIAGKSTVFRRITEIIVTLPMIFPPMALGFFLILILGKNGLIGGFLFNTFNFKIIFTFWGVLVAVFIVGLPFMVKSVQTARQQLDQNIVEAAQTLGKSNLVILHRVILPNITGGITTGLLLAFGRSVGEVGISLMLGGNIIGRTETLSLAIYNSVYEGDFARAAELSVLLSVMAIIVIVISNKSVIFKKKNN